MLFHSTALILCIPPLDLLFVASLSTSVHSLFVYRSLLLVLLAMDTLP